MPYLHFETNEGRIRLSNAIKQTAIESTEIKEEDDTKSVLAESDSGAHIKKWLHYDDGDPSESESDGDNTKGKAEQKVNQFKGVFHIDLEEEHSVLTCPSKIQVFQKNHSTTS